MAKNDNLSDFFKDLADTIRDKTNRTGVIAPKDISEAIENIEESGQGAFNTRAVCNIESGVNGVGKIFIFSGVEEIADNAYYAMKGLREVKFLGNTKKIGSQAFYDCGELHEIIFPESIEDVGGYAFDKTKWLANIEDDIVYINKCLYRYKGKDTSFSLQDDSTISISTAAFATTGVEELTIGSGIKRIHRMGITMPSLRILTINNSEDKEGVHLYNEALRSNSNMTDVEIGKVSICETDAFASCGKLRNIYIGNVATICSHGIANIAALSKVEIGHVDEIVGEGFYNCKALQEIIILNSDHLPVLSKNSFAFMPTGCTIYVPETMADLWVDKFSELGIKNPSIAVHQLNS